MARAARFPASFGCSMLDPVFKQPVFHQPAFDQLVPLRGFRF